MTVQAVLTTFSVAIVISLVSPAPGCADVIFVDPGNDLSTPGHPARAWTDVQKAIVDEALSEWKTFIPDFDKALGTWTLRWEDEDFFRDFRVPGGGGDDYRGVPAVTVRRGSFEKGNFPSPPRNSPDFPEGEIYFNVFPTDLWFFDPTPATDDPGEPPKDKLDFLTISKHEIGHALGIVGHLPDGSVAVMEEQISLGERHRVDPADIALYSQQVPEPSTAVLLLGGMCAIARLIRRQRVRGRDAQ